MRASFGVTFMVWVSFTARVGLWVTRALLRLVRPMNLLCH